MYERSSQNQSFETNNDCCFWSFCNIIYLSLYIGTLIVIGGGLAMFFYQPKPINANADCQVMEYVIQDSDNSFQTFTGGWNVDYKSRERPPLIQNTPTSVIPKYSTIEPAAPFYIKVENIFDDINDLRRELEKYQLNTTFNCHVEKCEPTDYVTDPCNNDDDDTLIFTASNVEWELTEDELPEFNTIPGYYKGLIAMYIGISCISIGVLITILILVYRQCSQCIDKRVKKKRSKSQNATPPMTSIPLSTKIDKQVYPAPPAYPPKDAIV